MDKTVKVQSGIAKESSAAKAIKVKTKIVDAAIIYVLSSLGILFIVIKKKD